MPAKTEAVKPARFFIITGAATIDGLLDRVEHHRGIAAPIVYPLGVGTVVFGCVEVASPDEQNR